MEYTFAVSSLVTSCQFTLRPALGGISPSLLLHNKVVWLMAVDLLADTRPTSNQWPYLNREHCSDPLASSFSALEIYFIDRADEHMPTLRV